ncbi:MAG: response regulator transcription factor [Anaerolineaceae bacterium]|nr:response regulator transcription factor [Anaerolineaceae bacterium]
MTKVLIIDDELRIVSGIRKYFEQAGYTVVEAFNGLNGLSLARTENPDLVVLDLMLPGMDGWDVCKEIRRDSDVPIIMLTARVEETEKIIGLELGADDYVTKPFSPRELVARARAVLRRTQSTRTLRKDVYKFGNVSFDAAARECIIGDRVEALTPTEFDLLLYFIRRRNQVCTRSMLLEAADLGVYEGVERTIDVHIYNLRKKIEADPSSPEFISTVFGVGYRFTAEVS